MPQCKHHSFYFLRLQTTKMTLHQFQSGWASQLKPLESAILLEHVRVFDVTESVESFPQILCWCPCRFKETTMYLFNWPMTVS